MTFRLLTWRLSRLFPVAVLMLLPTLVVAADRLKKVPNWEKS